MLEIPTESETGPPKKRGRKKKIGEESPADDEEREEREKEHQQAYKYRKGGYSEKKYRTNLAIGNAPSSKRKEELKSAGEKRSSLRPDNYRHKRTRRIITPPLGAPRVDLIDQELRDGEVENGTSETGTHGLKILGKIL